MKTNNDSASHIHFIIIIIILDYNTLSNFITITFLYLKLARRPHLHSSRIRTDSAGSLREIAREKWRNSTGFR